MLKTYQGLPENARVCWGNKLAVTVVAVVAVVAVPGDPPTLQVPSDMASWCLRGFPLTSVVRKVRGIKFWHHMRRMCRISVVPGMWGRRRMRRNSGATTL